MINQSKNVDLEKQLEFEFGWVLFSENLIIDFLFDSSQLQSIHFMGLMFELCVHNFFHSRNDSFGLVLFLFTFNVFVI